MDNFYNNSYIFEKKENYRKSVPKTVKDRLWDTTFGPEAGQGLCYVCGLKINSKRFEAGHIISVYHDGSTTLDNLKCICSTCNKSMGTQNLENFKLTYFPAIQKKIKDKHKKKCICGYHNEIDSIILNCNNLDLPIKENNFIYHTVVINKKIEEHITINTADYDTEDEEDEEKLQHIKKIKINLLDTYRYIPKE